MKRRSITLALALLAITSLLSASHLFNTAHAQSDRAQSEGGGPPEIIRHSRNEHGHNGFALTTGGTSATTRISYHGGQLIRTPVVYIIWYGNWNQANGSDTPAGQQIVRDFLTNVGGSP